MFMTGKKERPITEPMYSGGNLLDFPITSGFDSICYSKFLDSFINNSNNIVPSQSMHNGYLSAYFVKSKLYTPRPEVKWGIRRNFDSFLAFANKHERKTSMRIYSLAFDEVRRFGVFLMKNYGTEQVVLKSTSRIKTYGKLGFKITACAPLGQSFCIVMIKGVQRYNGRSQRYFTRPAWSDVETEIKKGYQAGEIITGICYSNELKKYFLVMTKMPRKQCYAWQVDNTNEEWRKREKFVEEQGEKGFYPSVIFTDPTNDQTLFVMTQDESIESCTCKVNYKMEG